jgi:hypothetical protein
MNTTTRPNFELLRDAFAIIDGIPNKAFKLDSWRENGDGPACGTIACAGGWLAMHPTMNQAGLRADAEGTPVTTATKPFSDWPLRWGFGALQEVFGLHGSGEVNLFEAHGFGYKDSELSDEQVEKLSGKRLWKRRVLRLFQEYDEPFNPKVGRGLMLSARNA